MSPLRVAPLLGLLSIVALPAFLDAQDQAGRPELGEPRPFRVPATERFTLENGLTVTLVPYGQTPKVTVRLVLPTGGVDEGPDEVWLANLTGDLLLEGTTTRDAERIATEAASMGGSLSLSVGADRTSMGGDVLEEFGPDMIHLIADVVTDPAFPSSQLDRLKNDRLRQLSVAAQQPSTLTQVEFLRRMYPTHAYGRSLPTADMVSGYSLERIRDFWSEHYGPTGAHLYVSGRFEPEAVRAAVREAFEAWPSSVQTEARMMATPETGPVTVFVERPGAPQSTLQLGLPVIDPSHEDYVPLQVTNALLGGTFASRITRNIREDKGYTYSPQSFLSSRYRTAYWVQSADVESAVTGAAIEEIRSEIERLRSEAPPEAELAGIRNYLAGIFVLQNSSRAGLIGQLSFLDLHGISEDYLTNYVDRIHAVTPEEVRRIAERYIRPEEMLLVVTGDPAVALPQLRAMGAVEVVTP
jgi:zinc protease